MLRSRFGAQAPVPGLRREAVGDAASIVYPRWVKCPSQMVFPQVARLPVDNLEGHQL
jgi:hypothetical protein